MTKETEYRTTIDEQQVQESGFEFPHDEYTDAEAIDSVSSFVFDRWRDRLSLMSACVGIAVFAIIVPIPPMMVGVGEALLSVPVIATVFVGYYVGRPLIAVYNHLTRDYEQYDALPSVSVVIPAYNEAGTISDVIDGVFDQPYPSPVEVVVCDDGSSDGTWSILQSLTQKYDRLTITKQENSGSSVARNNALSHATNEIVVSMDADTVLGDTALYEAGVSFCRQPDVVAVGTNVGVLNPTESLWTRMQVYNYLLSMEVSRMFQSQLGFVLVLSGGCSVFRREVLDAVDGWNDSTHFSDDYDLTIRVHRHGPIAYNPNIHAFTEVPATFRSLWKQRLLWRQRGTTVTLAHLNKQGRSTYGTLGLIGLPLRLSILLLIVWSMVTAVQALVGGQVALRSVVLAVGVGGTIVTSGLSAIMVCSAVLCCRDRTALEMPLSAFLYLFVYRWFHLTVRFTGTIYGLYRYVLYRREQSDDVASS